LSITFAERIALLSATLSRARIPHAFGGAVALAYYVAEPRSTRDIDLNVGVPVGDSGRVFAALPGGFVVPDDAVATVASRGQIRLSWEGVPVDLFFPQHDFHARVEADTSWVPFLHGRIPIISATHLVVFKALFNRSRDWPDVEAMLEAGVVDTDAALGWLARLVGADSDPYRRLTELVTEIHLPETGGRGPEEGDRRIDWSRFG
jgi:hypothetical protein